MAKIKINGEYYEFDRAHKPMSEMIALEKAMGITYGQWEADLQAGSARALAGFMWLVWRRNGRDVPFKDIESGEAEIDWDGFDVEQDGEPEGEAGDPTPPAPGSGPSPTGRAGGSSRSAKSA